MNKDMDETIAEKIIEKRNQEMNSKGLEKEYYN